MIDINKGSNNFEKFPSLIQKCDPVVLEQPNSLKSDAPSLTAPSPTAPTAAESEDTIASTIIASTTKHLQRAKAPKSYTRNNSNNNNSVINPVRAANQRFFLVSAFKDQNFLKKECEAALAQVAPPTQQSQHNQPIQQNKQEKSATTATGSAAFDNVSIAGRGEDNRNNNTCNNSNSNNNNKNNNSSIGRNNNSTSNRQGHHSNTLNQLHRYATAAAITNGMRRSGGSNGSHHQGATTSETSPNTSITSSTVHKVAIVFNHQTKVLSRIPKQPVGNALTIGATTKPNGRQVKPLVHRSIPSTAVAAANAASASVSAVIATTSATSAANKLNNNCTKKNISNISGNNSMQHSLDNDEIKYIDSDEVATLSASAGDRKQVYCEPRRCTNPQPQQQQQTHQQSLLTGTKSRTRPKSTIISSHNNFVFEKINNYKYANGSSSGTDASEAAAARRNELRHSGIDSNSIKASIEKFNSLSEHKRAVILRSHEISGSISNLQHHRHSSEFGTNNGNVVRLTSNGGGSLTRTPYRTASVSPAVLTVQSKVTTSLHANTTTASSSSSSIRTVFSSSSSSTNSLPTKSSISRNYELGLLRPPEHSASVGKEGPVEVSSKHQQDVIVLEINTNANVNVTGDAKKHASATTVGSLCDAEDSIRSTGLRSVPPPPPSPTASRYWDRDSSRTSSSLLSTTLANSTDEVSKLSSSDEKSQGLCGLRNIGNTCFMNSVIQCLSHTSELTKFLRTHNGIRSTSSKDQLILYEFAKLIREMWTSNVHSVTPMELKRAFSTKHRMYSDYNQQDAQEFLRFFLDSLHSALNTGVKGEPLKIDDNLSDNKKADLTWEWYARHENSLIRDLFVGQLKSTLRCTTCGNTSVTFDPFWDLSVPLPSSSRCKLDACLDLFIREEVLDGDEMPTCSKCRTRRRCTKSFTIQRFPKYLVIHLKRFSETRWSKMSNIVEFPTGERELNMGPYGSNPNTNMYYSLYAISNHMGSTAGGHYVALCKHPASRKWHEFNDNIVSESVSENHLVSSSAYILFYERA